MQIIGLLVKFSLSTGGYLSSTVDTLFQGEPINSGLRNTTSSN